MLCAVPGIGVAGPSGGFSEGPMDGPRHINPRHGINKVLSVTNFYELQI